jgi:hypothetical protein
LEKEGTRFWADGWTRREERIKQEKMDGVRRKWSLITWVEVWEVIGFESEDGPDPGETAGRQEGEIENEDSPVRDEEEQRAAGPRVLQQNCLRYW